jgi:hypothetical protein
MLMAVFFVVDILISAKAIIDPALLLAVLTFVVDILISADHQ